MLTSASAGQIRRGQSPRLKYGYRRQWTHAVFVALVQAVHIVRLTTCLVVLRGDIKELLPRFGEEPSLRDLERTGVAVRRLSRLDLIRFALHST